MCHDRLTFYGRLALMEFSCHISSHRWKANEVRIFREHVLRTLITFARNKNHDPNGQCRGEPGNEIHRLLLPPPPPTIIDTPPPKGLLWRQNFKKIKPFLSSENLVWYEPICFEASTFKIGDFTFYDSSIDIKSVCYLVHNFQFFPIFDIALWIISII